MSLPCESCGATDKPLDLDLRQDPPEHVCRACKRMAKCPKCKERRNRLIALPGGGSICGPCDRARAREAARQNARVCTACDADVDVSLTNDHGECQDCSMVRLRREHPTAGASTTRSYHGKLTNDGDVTPDWALVNCRPLCQRHATDCDRKCRHMSGHINECVLVECVEGRRLVGLAGMSAGDIIGTVRETVRLVLSSSGVVLAELQGDTLFPLGSGSPPDAFEMMLTKIANNVARQLTLAEKELTNAEESPH